MAPLPTATPITTPNARKHPGNPALIRALTAWDEGTVPV